MTVNEFIASQLPNPTEAVVGITVQGNTVYLCTAHNVFTIDSQGNIKLLQVTPA